jgi:DNA polymerase-1
MTRPKKKRMKTMSRSLLIIDGHNLAYRAHYKFNNFMTETGRPSGIAYGFLYVLQSLVKRFPCDEVHIAFDGGRSPVRLEIWPEYKKRDDKLGDDKALFMEQIDDLKELLPHLGCTVYYNRHVEADDIIYQIWRNHPKDSKTIISSDKDFVQLLGPRTKIFNPFKDVILSTINVEKEYGFSASEMVDYLILKGDKSDNIPGVSGLGDKRIRDFFDTHESIEEFLDKGSDVYLGRYDIGETYRRNYKLICLAWHHFKDKSRSLGLKKDFRPLPQEFLYKYQLRAFIKKEFLEPFKKLQ